MAEDTNWTQEEDVLPENSDNMNVPEGEPETPHPGETEVKKKRWGKKENKQLEEMGVKLMELNDKYLRLSAEFDNYRKRTLKERMELTKTAGEQILVGILPVMDNFERALASIERSSDIKALEEGVRLIYSNFRDFLSRNGVKEMETKEVDFDTDRHEAVTMIPVPEMKGKVVDTIEKGYVLNDKVIRYAKVVVGE